MKTFSEYLDCKDIHSILPMKLNFFKLQIEDSTKSKDTKVFIFLNTFTLQVENNTAEKFTKLINNLSVIILLWFIKKVPNLYVKILLGVPSK
ncbi:hypothetical protein HX13_04385 [Chryseobacterium sp. P1-3]|nr:hypothetical protein HX13_04385 [Chryseobacterium sp. P1-3]